MLLVYSNGLNQTLRNIISGRSQNLDLLLSTTTPQFNKSYVLFFSSILKEIQRTYTIDLFFFHFDSWTVSHNSTKCQDKFKKAEAHLHFWVQTNIPLSLHGLCSTSQIFWWNYNFSLLIIHEWEKFAKRSRVYMVVQRQKYCLMWSKGWLTDERGDFWTVEYLTISGKWFVNIFWSFILVFSVSTNCQKQTTGKLCY